MTVWRIVRRKHARTAFDGEGARLYGGRWNSRSIPMVYTAQSRSLAVLEILVHLDSPALLQKYVLLEATFDQSLITDLDRATLPRNWKVDPSPRSLQTIGDRWSASGQSAALRIPSVLVPEESNFLLNPRHADFPKIQISSPKPFHFDPRLTRRR